MIDIFSPQFILQILVRVLVVLTALPVHEYAHGLMAKKLGDYTATMQGRLTLNPIKHFDLIGTTALILTGFGWAKPVPINPYNLTRSKLGSKLGRKGSMALTALAGPVSNIILALISMVILKVLIYFVPMSINITDTVMLIFSVMINTNLGLAVFNLLPIPPLDGSRIFGMFFSDRINAMMYQYERYIFLGLLLLMTSGVLSYPIQLLSSYLFNFINFLTGFIDLLAR